MFHVKHEGWTAAELSPELLERLGAYEELLLSYAVPRGMVAASDSGHLHSRHILDSLRAVPLIPPDARIVDLGSGAGLPGIPVAVARPDLEMTLAEPRQSRAAFLELVVEALRLPDVAVWARPADQLTSRFDACLARGFGDVVRTWRVARDLLVPEGALIYWAGRTLGAADAPSDARVRVIGGSTLESGGPIVIMTRQ